MGPEEVRPQFRWMVVVAGGLRELTPRQKPECGEGRRRTGAVGVGHRDEGERGGRGRGQAGPLVIQASLRARHRWDLRRRLWIGRLCGWTLSPESSEDAGTLGP